MSDNMAIDNSRISSFDYPVQLNEVSPDGRIRSSIIFNCLQDAAGRDADRLGLGMHHLEEKNLIWVLSRIRVKMEKFPSHDDVIRVSTYHSGFDRLFAYRQFHLASAVTGELFGVAGSAWLSLNPANYRPVSPEKYFTALPRRDGEVEIYFQGDNLGKLRKPENIELSLPLTHRISAAQIDYNRHLNNAFYAFFTEDWLGEAATSLIRMRDIQLNFNSSTAFRDRLDCSGHCDTDGNFYVEGVQQSSGRNAFQARGVFEKITFE